MPQFFVFRFLDNFFKVREFPFLTPHLILLMSALILPFFAGCVSTTDFDATKTDLHQLKAESAELKTLASDLRKDINALREEASSYAKTEAFSAIRESQTSFYSQLSEISKELQILHGRFDENKFHTDKALKDDDKERELLRYQIANLDMKVKELNEKLMKLLEPVAPSSKAAPENPETLVQKKEPMEHGIETSDKRSTEDTASKTFETAHNLFKENKYTASREKFSDFIKKFPKNELAGDAQFQIAETYFAENDYESAILAYETLIKTYLNNPRIPAALLKQGEAFAEIGDKKTAWVIYEKLMEQYPASIEAEAAKKKLSEPEKKTKKKPDKTKQKKR